MVTGRLTRKWPRSRGHFPLVIPVTVTLNDYRSIAIMIVLAAMQSAIVSVKLSTRAAIVVAIAIIISVVTDAEAKTLRARDCRRCNRDGRYRGENTRTLRQASCS